MNAEEGNCIWRSVAEPLSQRFCSNYLLFNSSIAKLNATPTGGESNFLFFLNIQQVSLQHRKEKRVWLPSPHHLLILRLAFRLLV